MSQPRAIVPESGIRPGKNAHASVAIPNKRIVKLDVANGTDAVAIAAAATDVLYGVTAEELKAANVVSGGGWGDVQVDGKAIVTSGAAVTAGVRVTSDAAGKAVAWAPGAGVNHSILGLAITAASGADIDIEVELAKPGTVAQGA